MDKFIQGAIILQKYQIIKILGKGGFSHVYLATNLKVGNKVAIKVIDKELYESQLLAEKNMLIRLRHSSIVVIFDIEEDDEYFYLIEEYVEGQTLESVKGKLSEDEAKDIFTQLLDVFDFLHTNFNEPIIYRDLKPSNIMLMPNNRVKLIDFGIASPMERSASLEEYNYGTKSYCAPEQVCYGTTDKRTDIYSLGVTIYYLLTGKNLSHPPYKILTIRHFRKDVSEGFSELIRKMTETMPAKRYQNISEIIRDLNDLNRRDEGVLSDMEVFAKKSSRVMYISGIKRGIGVTHIAQMMAHFYSSLGKRVALVEWANRSDFIQLAGREEVVEMKRYYDDGGIFGYFYSPAGYEKIIEDDFDIILVDAGSYEEYSFKTAGMEGLETVIVASASDWDVNILEDMCFENSDKHTYLVNLKSEAYVADLRKIFDDLRIFSIAFNENPYEINKENLLSFERIFGGDLRKRPFVSDGIKEGRDGLIKESLKEGINNLGGLDEIFKRYKVKFEEFVKG